MKFAALLASAFVATTVQAAEVTLKYCLVDGPCTNASLEPFECINLRPPGFLESIQNTADCRLFEDPNCRGNFKAVARGSHGADELRDNYVGSLYCTKPSLPRNLAPAVQDSRVTVKYCVENGPCTDASVEPYKCNDLEPEYLSSFHNTADCSLYEWQGCDGPVKYFDSGSHGAAELYDTRVGSFKCSDPGLPRNLAPAVQVSDVEVYFCQADGSCTEASVEPNKCIDVRDPGFINTIQSNADCSLFYYQECRGSVTSITRGSHKLSNTYVGSFKCSEPRLQRNLAPAVQAADVTLSYCLDSGEWLTNT